MPLAARALVYLPAGRVLFGPVDALVEPVMPSRVYGVTIDGAQTADGRLVLTIAVAAPRALTEPRSPDLPTSLEC